MGLAVRPPQRRLERPPRAADRLQRSVRPINRNRNAWQAIGRASALARDGRLPLIGADACRGRENKSACST